ncbi:MAG: peptidoglycan DD-metalloendopeptidase family protein [Thermoleophilia bacterium]
MLITAAVPAAAWAVDIPVTAGSGAQAPPPTAAAPAPATPSAPAATQTPAAAALPLPGSYGGDPGDVPVGGATSGGLSLSLGAHGQTVRDLQRELRRRGAKLRVDGGYGPATRRAVMRQQRRMHLAATGVADAGFLARLGLQAERTAAVNLTTAAPTVVIRLAGWPTSGRLESPFGMRWGRMHEGIDISNATGTPVEAAADGTVSFVGTQSGYGNIIEVQHGSGVSTAYAHLSATHVVVGQHVAAGDLIGDMGGTGHVTGVHLHFEVRVNDTPTNPIPWLPPRPGDVVNGLSGG